MLESDVRTGLKEEKVSSLRQKYGSNLIPKKRKTPEIFLFLKQFNNPLIYLILAAAIVSLFLKKYFDAAFILIVVLVVTATAYYQERKVSRMLEELKKVVKIRATVLREGKKMEIDSQELVRGDIILLKAGDKVPVDGRLIQAKDLEINEAALTGEWLPSKKNTGVLAPDTVVADRENMVYLGTLVENGTGMAVCSAVGRETEMGKIALSLQEEKDKKTLLEKRLASFSKYYGAFVFFILLAIFSLGFLRKISPSDLFITLVATGVSAIPEGLLPAITIILVIGTKRILARKGLIRKLSILETLGSLQIILTDKTATLTEGKMRLVKILTGEELLGKNQQNHQLSLEIAALTSEAFIENPEDVVGQWKIRGRPTDRALLLAAIESGIELEKLKKNLVKIGELLFNPTRKYSAALYQSEKGGKTFYITGSPERILESSGFLRVGQQEVALNQEKMDLASFNLQDLTSKGFRVLGVACRKVREFKEGEAVEELMRDLVFVGFLALKDPLRKEAKEVIALARQMGLQPVIVSGDHLLTVKAIAEELGLKTDEDNILEAKDLDKLKEEELSKIIEKINVFARIDPHHKLRIVRAWQEKGRVVAMVGDGINDTPALKKADVGLSLGSGTELAKEVSDLVLLDDNFFTIIKSVEEGRGIFDKIRNITIYLVSSDFTELGFILFSVVLGFPLPLLATQILWINVIEDSFPALALTLEKREEETLSEKPREKGEEVLNHQAKIWMMAIGLVTILTELAFFLSYLRFGLPLAEARTFLFAATTLETLYLAFSHRSLRYKIIRKDIFSNRYLDLAVLAGLLLLSVGIYFPVVQKFLHTVPLGFLDWILIISCVSIEAAILERIKGRLFFVRKAPRGGNRAAF